MSVSPPLPLSSSAVAQPAVAVGKPAGMLVVVVRDSAGGLWIWSYERNRTPHSPPNRGVLGGEREAADLVESARSGVAASAVAMMREVGEESVMTPAWRRLVEAAVGRCPLGDTVTQLAPDKLESNADVGMGGRARASHAGGPEDCRDQWGSGRQRHGQGAKI